MTQRAGKTRKRRASLRLRLLISNVQLSVIAARTRMLMLVSTGEAKNRNAAVNRCAPDRFHIIEMRLGQIDRVELRLGAEQCNVVKADSKHVTQQALHP